MRHNIFPFNNTQAMAGYVSSVHFNLELKLFFFFGKQYFQNKMVQHGRSILAEDNWNNEKSFFLRKNVKKISCSSSSNVNICCFSS